MKKKKRYGMLGTALGYDAKSFRLPSMARPTLNIQILEEAEEGRMVISPKSAYNYYET